MSGMGRDPGRSRPTNQRERGGTMPQLDDAAGVKAHYLDEGTGPSVVVLHGGLETADDWAFLAEALVGERRVLRPERRGHGRTPDVNGPHTYEAMAEETAALIDQVVGEPVDLVGFSDGAITAMLLALARPELVRSMVVISGHLHHEALLPRMAERLANPDPDSPRLAPMREAYARTSPDGADHWSSFHRKVSTMGATSPALDPAVLGAVTAPCSWSPRTTTRWTSTTSWPSTRPCPTVPSRSCPIPPTCSTTRRRARSSSSSAGSSPATSRRGSCRCARRDPLIPAPPRCARWGGGPVGVNGAFGCCLLA